MLLFSTIFLLSNQVTRDSLSELVLQSFCPDGSLPDDVSEFLSNEVSGKEYSFSDSDVTVVRYLTDHRVGIRVKFYGESDFLHTLDFVYEDETKRLSIQEDVSSDSYVDANLVERKLPDVVRQLVWHEFLQLSFSYPELFGSADFSVYHGQPFLLRQEHAEFAGKILSGDFTESVPIVYVPCIRSGDTIGEYAVDYSSLAHALMGAAVVAVESSPLFSQRLRSYTSNVPDDHSIWLLHPDGWHDIWDVDANFSANRILDVILGCLLLVRVPKELSFTDVRFESVGSKSDEMKELYDLYDLELEERNTEIQKLKSELDDLRNQNHNLSCKVDALKQSKSNQQSNIGLCCKERPLYDGELNDVLLRVLSDAFSNMPDSLDAKQSRKYHVLQNILSENQPTGEEERVRKFFKTAVKDGNMDSRGLAEAQKYGFTFEKTSEHTHLQYHDDPRYSFAMGVSPSDGRAGQNFYTTYMNMLFGY